MRVSPKRRYAWYLSALVSTLLVATSFLATLATPVDAAQTIPYKINFQGRLTDNNGNILPDGSYNIKFRIWDALTSGSNQWEGDRVFGASDHRVVVANGLFNTQFGDTSQGDPALSPTLFSGTFPLYLEVELPTPATATCASNGCATFTEGPMTPRQALASAPYAFNSDTLDGLDSSAFGQLAVTNQTWTGANLFAPTASSTVALTVKATTAGGSNALEVFDSSGSRQSYFDNNGALTTLKPITAPTSTNTINNLVINNGSLTNVGANITGSGAVTLASTTSALTLTSGSGTIIAGSGILQRSASTLTLDVTNAGTSTLNVSNSNGANVANLNVTGTIAANTSGTINGLSVNSGTLSGVTGITQTSGTDSLTSAAPSGSAVSVTDAAFNTNNSNLLNLSFTNAASSGTIGVNGINIAPTGTNNASGANTLNGINLANAAAATNNTFNGLNVGTGYTSVLATTSSPVASATASLVQLTGAIASGSANGTYIGANPSAFTGDFVNLQVNGLTRLNVSSFGDVTGGATLLAGSSTTNGTSGLSTSTSLVVTSAASFTVGNYVQVNDTNCGGAGINPCYAKITAKVSNTLTITPALTWTSGKTVNQYHFPEIGGIDASQTLANRYGRGYFISGVATGNGTTYYNEDSVESNLTTFSLLNNNVTTLNVGGAATTINLGNSGGTVSLPGSLSVTGTISGGAPSTGTSGYFQRSSTTLSPATSGDSISTSGNILTTGTGTITSAGAITGPTATNTINGAVINSGALSSITTLGLSGAITGATSTNTINNLVINNGSLSNVGNITAAGNLTVTAGTTSALNLTGSAASTFDVGNNLLSIQTTNNGAVTTGNGAFTTGTGLVTHGGNVTFSGTTARTITGPSTGGLTETVASGPLTLSTTTSGAIAVTSAAALNLTGAAASSFDVGNNLLSLQTANNGAITTGTGLLTQGGNMTFSGTAARTITGPTTGGLTATVASGPLTLSTTTSGAIAVTSAAALNLTGAAASAFDIGNNLLSIQTANNGAVTFGNGAITTGTGLFTEGGNVTFSGTTARTITGPSTGGLTETVASGPLTLSTTTSGAIAVTSAAALNLTGAAASTFDIGNNQLSLQTTGNGAITTGTGLLTQGGNITFSGTTARTITGPSTGGLTETVASGSLTLSTTTSGTIAVTSAGAINLTGAAASSFDIGNNTFSVQTTNNGAITTGTGLFTQGGNVTFSGTTARTITGPSTGGLTETVASGPLTLSTTTSGAIAVTSAAALNLTGAAASTWDIGNNVLSVQTTGNGAITTGNGAFTTGTGLVTHGGSLTFSGTTARTITGPTTGGLTETVASGPLTLSTTTSGALALNSAAALNFTGAAASSWDIGANTLSLQTTGNGAITTGTGLLTQGGNMTFSGTAARTITGPSTGGLTATVASGPLTLSTTSSGTLAVTSAAALNLTGAAASSFDIGNNLLSIQTTNNGAITIGNGAFTTGTGLVTHGGSLTFSGTAARTITGPSTGGLTETVDSGPLTVSTTTSGALAVTSAGALTLTGAAASTWSTSGAAPLTIQSGSGTLSLGSTTALTAAGALGISSTGANALTLTSGSGTIALGSSTVQRAASSLTLDVANAGTSTLNVINSNGSNIANLSVSGNITSGNLLTSQISKVEVYGHSYTTGYGGTSFNTRYSTLLATMLHAKEYNKGVNGAAAAFYNAGAAGDGGWVTMLNNAVPTRTAAPYLARPGIGIINYGINDIAYYASTNSSPYLEAMRTMIARYRAAALFKDTDPSVAYGGSGTWIGNPGCGACSQANIHSNTTVGGTVTITVPADFPGGEIDLGFVSNGGTASYSFTYDGSAAGTLATVNMAPAGEYTGVIKRLTGLAAAGGSTHTIVATITALSGGGVGYFDYWQIAAPTPPLLLIPNIVRATNYSTIYGSFPHVPTDSDVNTLNASLATLISSFDSNVVLVDVDSAINKVAANFYADNLHLNDQGQALTAATVYKAIQAAPITLTQISQTAGPAADSTYQKVFQTTADSTTAFQVQNTSGISILDVDSTNSRVGINTVAPTAVLDIRGLAAAAATANNGAAGTTGFNVLAGSGQATSAASGKSGGAGGGITIASGAGGNATGTSTNGNGGAIALQGGAAGTGGSGGSIGVVTLQGTGGNVGIGTLAPTAVLNVVGQAPAAATASSGTSAPTAFLLAGAAGQGTTAGSGQTGGNGSGVTITAGNGGGAAGTSTNGTGGSILLQGGAAGTGGTGGSAGSVTVKPVAGGDSPTAFLVQNASATATLFNVDTTVNATNLITAVGAGLETAASPAAAGWTGKGTGPAALALSNSAALSFIGSQSLKVTTTAAIGDGAKYAFSLTNATTYTLSFYAKLDAASGVFNTMSAGYNDGSNDHDCIVVPVGNNTPVVTTQWNRYYCTFVPTSGTNIYIKQTDAAVHTFYLDAIQLESGTTTPTTYREGTVSFGGAQLVAPTLNACDNIATDTAGNFNCGSGLVNHINVVDASGHSITRAITQQGNGASSPDYRWVTRLANSLHSQEINRGVDGASAYFDTSTLGGFNSVLQNITPPRNATLTPGNVVPTAPYIARTGIGLVQLGINDLGGLIPSTNGSTNTSGCTAASNCNLIDYKEAMRTIIARYRASAVFEETSNSNSSNPLVAAPCTTAAYCISFANGTDTWSQNTSTTQATWSSGTGNEVLTGSGTGTQGTVTICLPADLNNTGGTVDVGLIADALAGQGGTHSFALDGTAVSSINTSGLLSTSNNTTGVISSGRVIESIVRRVAVPAGAPATATVGCNSASQHKLVDTITGVASGANTYFDYFQIEAPQPEPVLVLNIAHDPNSNYSIYSGIAGDVVPGDTDVTNINNVLTGLVNEFDSNVQIVDEDTALNRNPNNFSSDFLHPNDAGHAAIANAVYKSLVNWPVPVQQAAQSTVGPGFYTFSATNFTVQNSLQQPTLLVNTTALNPGGTLANLVLNPSFETDAQNWIANGSGSNVINRSTNSTTAPAFSGTSSLQVVTSGAAHDGARYKVTLANSTAYTLSFYARLATGDATPFTTLEAGYINTTPTSVTCTLSSTTVVNTGWQRYSCPFTTVNPLAAGGIYIGSDATTHTFYIDGVLLQQVSSTVNPYLEGGSINLVGSITGPVNFQNTSNSTNSFNVQNSAGYDLILGDTLNNRLGFLTNNVNNVAPPSNDFTIGTLSTADANAIVAINPTGTPGVSASSKALVVQGSSGETGNIFEVQTSAGPSTGLLFSVNGNTSTVQIGSATTDTTQINLQLDSNSNFADTGTCNATTNQGALYYNTNTNAIRGCVNSAWEDVVTTGGLGLIAFGVVPDSGSNPGDIQSLTTAATATGPCKPYWIDATHVGWTACTAYSGGRKVVVTAVTTAGAGNALSASGAANTYQHLCLTGTGNQPALSARGADNADLPTFSANNPILCLASIKMATLNNATINAIFDTRVFSTSVKQFAYVATTGMSPGMLATVSGGKIIATTTATTILEGVVGVTDGNVVGANGAPNAILITSGLVFVKATAGAAGNFLAPGATTGYATPTATAPTYPVGGGPAGYIYGGYVLSATSIGTCSTQINCQGSVLSNLIIR